MPNLSDKQAVLAHWRRAGVSEDALEDLYTLAIAINDNDARGEEHHDPLPVAKAEGWNGEALEYMVEQRGIRIAALVEGGQAALSMLMAGMPFGAIDKRLTVATRLGWLDGFVAAATATRQRNEKD